MATGALADKRVALVIGNGEYGKVGKLPNPANDANAVAGGKVRGGRDQEGSWCRRAAPGPA